jgi:hypothetical protein
MTREEQLKFCSVCKHRKMDMQQGMLCELTNAKADFDSTCPNYDEDAKEKAKNERIEKEYQETLTVSGWLAFFLWVGVIGSAILTSYFAYITLSNLFYSNTLWDVLYVINVGSYLLAAILTVKAFYKKSTNAVALAMTFIAMNAISAICNVIICSTSYATEFILPSAQSIVWAIIWFSYVYNSEQVENMIPVKTRTWELTEKILLIVFTISSLPFFLF